METKIKTRRQHFVTFYSPGTLFDESSGNPIETWDCETAIRMSKEICERHGAKPYGFRFSTSIIAEPIEDGEGGKLNVSPRQIAESGTYFINGTLRMLGEIEAEAKEGDSILISNMRGNGYPIVCETRNSCRHTAMFNESDCVVDGDTGQITIRGDSDELKSYRKSTMERVKQERGY